MDAENDQREPYTTEELRLLFESEDYRTLSFRRSADFWLPLLGYFTGARLSELVSAKVEQVKQRDGIGFLLLSPGGERSRETRQSRREVPLHPALFDAGLKDYLDTLQAEGHSRLFPCVPLGSSAARHFTDYQRSVGIGGRENKGRHPKSFHSFRSNFIAALVRAGCAEDMARRLAGHAGKDVHAHRYLGRNQLAQKLDAVQTIQAPFHVPKWFDTPEQQFARIHKRARTIPRKPIPHDQATQLNRG